MWTTSEVCRFSAAVVAGLLAVVLLRGHRRDPTGIASVVLLAAVAAHLVLPLLLRRGAAAPVVHATVLLSLSVAPAFWLLSQVHFEDEFRVRLVHRLAAAGFLVVGYLAWLATSRAWLPADPLLRGPERFWEVLPRILALAIVLHALMRVYAGIGSDLVLPRLRARFAVLLISGTYVLVVLLGEALLSGTDSAAAADSVHSVAVLCLLIGVSFLALRVAPEVLRAPRLALDRTALDPALGERLRELIEAGEVLREEGLTIRGLAERLGAQEYKVRQLINAQLGFRNFNAFLNRYRVDAAVRLLADPAAAHLGIAEIAYRVGYRSVATFNKAFRDLNDCTPSEYRSAHLASAPAAQSIR